MVEVELATDELDPFAPEHRADPHPVWRRLRSEDPVHASPRGWLVTRYRDATAVLRDHRFSASPTHRRGGDLVPTGPRQPGTRLLVFLDPPDHTRLRGLVNKAFTPQVVRGLRPRVEALVGELLDQVEPRGRMELLGDLAYPLPVAVICELLGVPAADRRQFRAWSAAAARLLDGELPEDALAQGVEAVAGFVAYFGELLGDRRRHPAGDLLSALVAAEEAGDRLTLEELQATVVLLFVAGHETTVNLIGNGVLALLRHPDQLRRLRADPGLGRLAVEELLRFDGPVTVTARFATVASEVGGQPIAAGEEVVVSLAAANRDPEVFAEPDRLDLGRADNHHLAFSAGMHYCLGASLARLEGEVALRALLGRLPRLRLAGPEPRWRDHLVLRGLDSLELAF